MRVQAGNHLACRGSDWPCLWLVGIQIGKIVAWCHIWLVGVCAARMLLEGIRAIIALGWIVRVSFDRTTRGQETACLLECIHQPLGPPEGVFLHATEG